MDNFLTAYHGLNVEQKRAVDAIDGPVMVIAGPGTGKTQVLAVRIANILTKTDTAPDSVLCLTFTNAGVKAMRERLMSMIGPTASRVNIATFHSFAMSQIEKFYQAVGYDAVPETLDATSSVVLFDELLHSREWAYVPRTNKGKHINDIQSLISNLKREGIAPDAFRQAISQEIEALKNDPASISSRGESKGQMKKEIEKKIESLERSAEVADFYEAYEILRKERNVVDYNDILELLVRIVELSDEARDTIRENFQYVLVDEHQDSSGIQNKFLEAVWQDSPVQPNIFVVGDDRQLIYGFGGASLDYFKAFKHAFGKAELITLTKNYRSSQTILDAAEQLLQSSLADGKLIGNADTAHSLQLVEADYPRDEIIAAGLSFKQLQENEEALYDHCAILVPKNRHVKAAMQVLRDMGLPVAAATALQLFELADTQALLNVLRVIAHPFDTVPLSRSVLDPIAGIEIMTAHQFLLQNDPRKLTIPTLLQSNDASIQQWGEKLQTWLAMAVQHDAYHMIQLIGDDCLLGTATDDAVIRRRVEIIRTLLHIALMQAERGAKVDVATFVAFIDRMQEYNEDISLAVFGADKGIKVLTLHGSKGLEFDAVWIAHMDEKSLMAGKRQAFALPESIEARIEERDEEVKKRQLYVAVTRAKRFCTISYSRHSYAGGEQHLASIIAEMPQELFIKKDLSENEEAILQADGNLYVTSQSLPDVHDMTELASEEYQNRKVSVTMLNNFFECPWKWYFRSLLQLPEPMNDALHVGNIVHKNIEALLKGKKFDIEEYAMAEARYNEVDARRFAGHAKTIVKHWTEQYLPHITEPFLTEKGYQYLDPAFPHLSIFGKIDLVEDIAAGDVRVTDWKTGGAKANAEIEKRDEEGRMSGLLRQLAMYSYLVNGFSRGSTVVAESRLIFLEAKKGDKNAVQSRRIGSEEIELIRKDIEDYDTSVKTGQWVNRACHAKSYGQDTECEYCAMAKRYSLKAN